MSSLWTEKEKNSLIYVSASIAIICVITGLWILPENCFFYETRQVPFLCDGIDLSKPQEPCPICSNETVATVGRMFVLLGMFVLLVPAIVYGVRLRERKMNTDDLRLRFDSGTESKELKEKFHRKP